MGRPQLLSTSPFPSNTQKLLKFLYSNGEQAVKNNLVAVNNSTGVVEYNQEQTTFNFNHTLLPNLLTNGSIYKIKIRVADKDNNWSDFSDEILIIVLSMPALGIVNLFSVNLSNYSFQGSLTQSEGDILSSYKFILYDRNGLLIGASVTKTDGLLQHSFVGLSDNEQYKIEMAVVMKSGMTNTTGLLNFSVNYITPQIASSLILENLFDKGQIKITTNIIRIEAKTPTNPYIYIENEKIDLRNNIITYNKGISISNDFDAKMYGYNLVDNSEFYIMCGENDTDSAKHRIILKRIGSKIYCNKIVGAINYSIYTDFDMSDPNKKIVIGLQQIDDLLNLYAVEE
ncbi:hypothetical protein G9F71_008240 [Clostridium sp. FP2]|uniref:hypothetical protein n=1 Tax=Clostridium sp. FP2 TaxID=2724481 RepID=UPI001A9BC4D7|nr:hypothetical protein [Clostridium sp. FP2]MBZ9622840.1 hypothetical protein [Clostridium sp. FP2]